MCIVREGGVPIVKGFIDQVFSIGFLIMSYFFFKRTANGIIDFDEDDNDINNEINDNDDDDELFPRNSDNTLRCPKCDGSGKFSWGNTLDQCDLCYGSGSLSIRMKNKNIKGLPNDVNDNWIE